jgi:phosphoglycerate dehydrogenase-like enzyme
VNIFVDLALPPGALAQLQAGTTGHQLLFAHTPASSVLSRPEPDPQLARAEIAFGQPDPVAIAGASALKWIHISSSGITRYDHPEFRALMAERNVAVSNSAGVYCEACAVHVLSFLLAQARNLPLALRSPLPNGAPAWNALRQASSTLRGETVLILGYGAIGRCLAPMLALLGMDVIAFRRHPQGDESVPVVTEKELAPAWQRARHLINILPDNAQTRGFFDATRFAALPPGAIFYNIGRGTTVDQAALGEALRSGRLHAAWLDVTDPEPLPQDHPLRRQPNCFITPHVAGGQPDEYQALVRHFLANLQRFVHQRPLVDRVI